jgi:fermentation-respiration switch protein FrsA (DUF1100 family)
MRFSVICAEDVPFFNRATPEADGGSEGGSEGGFEDGSEGGYLGDYFMRSFRTVCETWPRGEIPAAFKGPVRSDIPVLIISGEADPVTPPHNGELAAETLPNSLHLVVPGQGHVNIFRGCLPNLATDFVENGSTLGLETACVEALHPLPFFLTFNGPNP